MQHRQAGTGTSSFFDENGAARWVKTERQGNFRYGCFVHVSVARWDETAQSREGRWDGVEEEGKVEFTPPR